MSTIEPRKTIKSFVIIKRALVTGGAGFIGSHLVDALLAGGAAVVVYDNFRTGHAKFLPPNPAKLQVVRGDVLDLPALTAACAGCDFVFHFQANADVRGGRENPRVDLEQNTITTWNALEAAQVNGVKGFAFASSSAVYGEPEIFPTPENYAPQQTSLYGASKLAGEAMIQAYSEYYDLRSFCYRFVSWIGERYTHGIVFDILKKLQRDPHRLPLFGDGTQKKSYLYVKDGVSGVMLGSKRRRRGKMSSILATITSSPSLKSSELFLDELGSRGVKLEFAGGKRGWPGDSPLVHLDTAKIKKLGWKPETSIEEGIRRTVRYLKQNPHLLQRA